MHYSKNMKLLSGILLLLVFVSLSIVGPAFAPYDLEYNKKIGYIEKNGEEILTASPFPPSEEFLFGTDKWGYDILTLLLYGAKYTVFGTIIIAFLRVAIGGLAGLVFGLASKNRKAGNSFSLWSAIPNFIIIYFIMIGININSPIPSIWLLFIQGFLMVILGLAGVEKTVREKTAEVSKNLYVQAARTLGASKKHLLFKHILPAMKGDFLILLVNEAILALHLIGQLGIFDLFFGGTKQQLLPTIYISVTKEWSGLIGQARGFMYHSQWVILFPLLVYILFLFALYLLSAGLNEVQRSKERKPGLL